jgi:CheY-like chemotaxis protein
LFEPFFTTKPEGRGTGLGLATVFGIMHQSGGRIAVESEKGRGTRFELFFPAESSTAAASPSVPAPADVPRGHETLLVVDDDSLVRSAAAAVLRRYGYEVLEAGSAGDALLIAEQHPYEIHAVVTDVVMPRMNGHILAERLKAMRPGLKVLITSGYTDDALLERGVETETFAFVPKPFTPSLLVSSIRALFDGSERP